MTRDDGAECGQAASCRRILGSMLHRHALALLLIPTFGLVACGPSHTGLCELAADCGEGREPEIEACVVDMDAREEQADIFSCSLEWDTYLDCLDDAGSCMDGALGGCDSQRDAFNECVGRRRSGNAKVELKAAE